MKHCDHGVAWDFGTESRDWIMMRGNLISIIFILIIFIIHY